MPSAVSGVKLELDLMFFVNEWIFPPPTLIEDYAELHPRVQRALAQLRESFPSFREWATKVPRAATDMRGRG